MLRSDRDPPLCRMCYQPQAGRNRECRGLANRPETLGIVAWGGRVAMKSPQSYVVTGIRSMQDVLPAEVGRNRSDKAGFHLLELGIRERQWNT